MKTLFPLLLADDPDQAADFYRTLFAFETLVDVGWYVQLKSPANDGMQIAFMDRDHQSVPTGFRTRPAGVVITLEFDDVDVIYERARQIGLPRHVELRDEAWGQRHFITEDPTGLLVDVVKPIPPTRAFLEEHRPVDRVSPDA